MKPESMAIAQADSRMDFHNWSHWEDHVGQPGRMLAIRSEETWGLEKGAAACSAAAHMAIDPEVTGRWSGYTVGRDSEA